MKAATKIDADKAKRELFQSTPPVKAATLLNDDAVIVCNISIHAAREGGDPVADGSAEEEDISIHAAREGGDATAITM